MNLTGDYLFNNMIHIQLKIYPDKFVLWNEGKLPKDITIESLKGIHPSRPRNELIAGTFFYAGTIDIMDACKEEGLPEPTYWKAFGGFELTMSKDIYTEEYLSKLELNDRQL